MEFERDRHWSRVDWTDLADRLLAGALQWSSPGRGRVTLPGEVGGYGVDVDGLEGFARTFLLAGFRIAGERGIGVADLVDAYRQGVTTGVDPAAPDRWVRLSEHPQAKVEAASIALALDMTRQWIWDHLDLRTQERVIGYLAEAVGDDSYPRTNWLWFRIVVQTFLRSVGGPWSQQEILEDLDRHDAFRRGGGWISDGEQRSYDHYVGWALHTYPTLWARMAGAAEFAAPRSDRDRKDLDRFLLDATALIGSDGSPLIQGRSLIYRFATAAPFWVGVLADVPSTSNGALRSAAERSVKHFLARGVPDADGVLSLGWFHEWRPMAQSYSGPSSPYWAVKGLMGVMLPAEHPVWAAPGEALPIDTRDQARLVRAAGWLVSATRADGIVRIVNHGTDHASVGDQVGDSPLYARLGYSTATAPLMDHTSWQNPLDQSVVLVRDGASTHRGGFESLGVRREAGALVGASAWEARVLTPDEHQVAHGSGLTGSTRCWGRILVQSIVRGPWEVRIVQVSGDTPMGAVLRVGGWALTGGHDVDNHVLAGSLVSSIRCLSHSAHEHVVEAVDATPLGDRALVPVAELSPFSAEPSVFLVTLDGAGAGDSSSATADIEDSTVSLFWPDGHRSQHTLVQLGSQSQSEGTCAS